MIIEPVNCCYRNVWTIARSRKISTSSINSFFYHLSQVKPNAGDVGLLVSDLSK